MNTVQTAMVDFGESDGTRVPWLVETYLPAVDDVVLMKDGDGNACYGRVDELDEATELAMLVPDWDTWIPARTPLEIRTELSQGAVGARFRVTAGQVTVGAIGRVTPTAVISYA